MFERRRLPVWSGLCVVLLALISCRAQGAENGHWKSSFSEAEAEAKRLHLPLLIHFHATWCSPCRKMEATVLNSPELGAYLKDRVVGVKVDIDQQPSVANRFGVRLLPSDRIVSPEGRVLYSNEGYVAKGTYLATLDQNSRIPKKAPQATMVQAPGSQTLQTQPVNNAPRPMVLAMEGYCPVTLWRTREWIKGKQEYALQYLGVVYYFKGTEERDEFQKEATRYSPKFAGCDPVTFWETQKAVQGNPKHAAFFDGQLYLFENEESRVKFREAPQRYLHQRKLVQSDAIESRTWH